MGDVVVEGERLYGDDVNIAARLESLAIPGGICISGTVYDHVENKLALHYEYQGEQTVKNIAKPVRVYRVTSDTEPVSPVGAARRGRPSAQPRRMRPVYRWVMAGLLLVTVTIGAIRYLSFPYSALGTRDSVPRRRLRRYRCP